MKSSDLRNVVLLGHGGVGKTSAAEAMLYNAGAADRLGRINEGNTILDYDQEEIRRQASVSLAIAPLRLEEFYCKYYRYLPIFRLCGRNA